MKPTEQTALVLEPQSSAALAQPTPMHLLEMAMTRQDFDVNKLEALMEMQFRWEANEARKAYHAAIAQFKQHPPRITKNKHVNVRFKDGGGMEYDHATLDNICDAIIPALSKVGITHRWDTKQEGARITISCTLTHEKGHSEKTELSGPADDSGKKNAIQQVASTVTYLQRYTLLAAVGMATGGQDDDGHGGSDRPEMAEQAYVAHMDNIQNSRSLDELKTVYASAYKDAKAAKDDDALRAFIKAYENRKAEVR